MSEAQLRNDDAVAPPVARWERLCAWGAFAVTVPSAVWRVLMILGLMPGTADLRAYELGDNPALGYTYVFALSVVQLGCGFLTTGLIKPWGLRIGRRRIPVWLPVTLGILGGLTVTWLFDVAMVTAIANGSRPDAGLVSGGPLVLMVACYIPILFWGPLVLVSVYAYWRRRRNRGDSGTLSG